MSNGPSIHKQHEVISFIIALIEFIILFITHSLDSSSQLFFAQLLVILPYFINALYSIVPTKKCWTKLSILGETSYWISFIMAIALLVFTILGIAGLIRINGSVQNQVTYKMWHITLNTFTILIPELIAISIIRGYTEYIDNKSIKIKMDLSKGRKSDYK